MPNSLRMRPENLNAAIAFLFMLGSACFGLAAIPFYATVVGLLPDAMTFLAGSLLFAAASYLRLVQAQSPWMAPGVAYGPQRPVLWDWLPRNRNWLSAAIHLLGTLAFVVGTLVAVAVSLTNPQQIGAAVWRPDVIGSALFVVSSAFAVLVASGRFWSWKPRSIPWRVAWLNMLGSVAFLASAIARYFVSSGGTHAGALWTNAGTFLGAMCFLEGAALLLPAWKAATETE